MAYLEAFGSSAVAPAVKWHLAQSVYGRYSGEIRWPDPVDQHRSPRVAIRGLFVAATDCSWITYDIIGNKLAVTGPDSWYDRAIELTDQAAVAARGRFALSHFPPRPVRAKLTGQEIDDE